MREGVWEGEREGGRSEGRVKNYYWPLAVFRPKLSNGQPLSKVVGRLGQASSIMPGQNF